MTYGGGDENKTKKQVAIIGLSCIVLLAIGAAVTGGVTWKNTGDDDSKTSGKSAEISDSMKAIKTMCQPTDYTETCVKTLKSSGVNSTDPNQIIQAAFKVAEKYVAEAAKKSTTLKELEKDPRAQQALQNCKELMEYAIDDLKTSFERLGAFDLSAVDEALMDLKVWLSAAITYQETCLDGFQNTTSDAGQKMRAALKTAGELTSNGLAMVTEIQSAIAGMDLGRKLLSDEDIPLSKRRLLATRVPHLKPDLVVAKDGSGKCKTINEALKHIPSKSNKTFVLYIKEGVYKEQVEFDKTMTHVMLVGDGPTKTRITADKNFVDGTPTFKTATVTVKGDHFIARDIGFENSAGAIKHQAVALRVQSDMSVFYNCQMDGYQDTLYAHTKRQFYRDCTISGTIDFIFGDSPAVFQNCTMLVRKPLENQQCIVTAQGRKERRQPSAIILQNCTITADPSYTPYKSQFKSYLGRPWKEYSRTLIVGSYVDDIIHPDGWLPWEGDFGLNTCFYGEFQNRGPGAGTTKRVKWRGIKTITAEKVEEFTAINFFKGDLFIRATGFPYNRGKLIKPN